MKNALTPAIKILVDQLTVIEKIQLVQDILATCGTTVLLDPSPFDDNHKQYETDFDKVRNYLSNKLETCVTNVATGALGFPIESVSGFLTEKGVKDTLYVAEVMTKAGWVETKNYHEFPILPGIRQRIWVIPNKPF